MYKHNTLMINLKNRNYLLYFLFAIMFVLIIMNKKNLHVDEIWTYGLANSSAGGITPVNGEVYQPADRIYMEYVSVDENNRFNYKNVWNNQVKDTHPPMYYVLVHTICSLFPGKFSTWYAAIFNLFFALLTLMAVRCLLYELTQSENAVVYGSISFIFSAGILSEASFLRMYIMAMFEVTFITLLFVRAVNRKCTWKFYTLVILSSVIGALTHYYYIVYLFFLCLIFGLYLLINQRYKDVGIFIVSMIASAALAVGIFPGMIKHIFLKEGYRGQESFENLKQSSIVEYGNRLKTFYSFINEELFGGILTYIIIAILLFGIWKVVKEENVRGG